MLLFANIKQEIKKKKQFKKNKDFPLTLAVNITIPSYLIKIHKTDYHNIKLLIDYFVTLLT